MSLNNPTKARAEWLAQREIAPNRLVSAISQLRRGDVSLRVFVCALAILIMWLSTGGWKPVFRYRTYQTPTRDVVARVSFEVEDPIRTASERERVRRGVQCVYDHDQQPIIDLRKALKGRVFEVLEAATLQDLDPQTWREFSPPAEADESESFNPNEAFVSFRAGLEGDENLNDFEMNLSKALDEIERYGLLQKVQHELGEGSQAEICVYQQASGQMVPRVRIEQVRIAEVLPRLRVWLTESFGSPDVAGPVYYWLRRGITPTLKFNLTATEQARQEAESDVRTVMTIYRQGEDILAAGGQPMTSENVALLRREYDAYLDSLPVGRKVTRSMAGIGMYVALYLLCGAYIYFRQPALIHDFKRFVALQVIAVTTVVLCQLTSWDRLQAELVPLVLFSMTLAIAHGQEMALLLSAAICLIVSVSLGLGLSQFVVYAASMAATILMLRHIRSRTKLIYIGIGAAVVSFLTTLGVGIVLDIAAPGPLFILASWYALFALMAAIFMAGLFLPIVEKSLDVQTEISLLELGDVAHPLLQELVRRAPGTYNHSINVASIAEAAAESIGANGLLVRVGAYFHDIGKMLKPQYFVENQGQESNRHEALLPAMSTLIIIAHVKDGADLARQHHLPKPMIDFILQHHGTTLVEYFYDRANRQSEEDPNGGEVDEGSYRYPGPRPQSREAAVLMLADAVESASRSLQEPAPARIESLVNEIAMKRLLDGQFDDCQLTLKELRTVQDSLVKSLTAMYHGRVKYPDQQSA